MRQLRLLPLDGKHHEEADLVLIQDIESKLYFVWRQQDMDTAQDTLETLQASWDRDPLEREKDLQVNFVNAIDRTLFRRPR